MGKGRGSTWRLRAGLIGTLLGVVLGAGYLFLDPRGLVVRLLVGVSIAVAGFGLGALVAGRRREALKSERILALQEELRASQDHIMESATFRSLGTYLEIVAHRMKRPLREVVDAVQALSSDAADSDVLSSKVEGLRDGTRDLQDTLHHLAEYSLTRPGRAPFSVNILLQHAIALCRYRASEKRIRIEEHYAVIPPVFGPAERIEGAILNVLINAIEAMPFEGGTMIVETLHERDRVVARVRDTGLGVKPEHLGKIFDPFFTTKPEKNGVGLGLWATRQALDIIGADVSITSAPFKGTEVSLSFEQAAPLRPGREGTTHPPELPRNTADETGRQIA
jgi:signal transduction histidine kinase